MKKDFLGARTPPKGWAVRLAGGAKLPSATTPPAQAMLDYAYATGNDKLVERLLSSVAILPSAEELKAEFGCDYFEQVGDVVVVQDSDDRAAR